MEGMLIFIGALIVFVMMIVIFIYNGHVNRRNAVDYAYASIDVQLKKRWDLIPNLVNTVKGYAAHEKELFESITQARQQARNSHDASATRFSHEGTLDSALPHLMAVAEGYPEIKADRGFLNLQRNLTEVESQISAARRAFNSAVMDYNNGVDMFPSSVFASMFGFHRRAHFETSSAERSNPSLNI
ncbi:MAG: LemA family protein [Akkermansiaceae bacterium]